MKTCPKVKTNYNQYYLFIVCVGVYMCGKYTCLDIWTCTWIYMDRRKNSRRHQRFSVECHPLLATVVFFETLSLCVPWAQLFEYIARVNTFRYVSNSSPRVGCIYGHCYTRHLNGFCTFEWDSVLRFYTYREALFALNNLTSSII